MGAPDQETAEVPKLFIASLGLSAQELERRIQAPEGVTLESACQDNKHRLIVNGDVAERNLDKVIIPSPEVITLQGLRAVFTFNGEDSGQEVRVYGNYWRKRPSFEVSEYVGRILILRKV